MVAHFGGATLSTKTVCITVERERSTDKGDDDMTKPSEKKTTEPKPKVAVVPRTDDYYTSRTANTQEAIDALPDGKVKQQMQWALDDVLTPPETCEDDKQRYALYQYLKNMDSQHKIDSIKSVRTSDPHTASYHAYTRTFAVALLNADADFTAFAPLRKVTTDPTRTLSFDDLVSHLQGKYEDAHPYDKTATYDLPTNDDDEDTPEVVEE